MVASQVDTDSSSHEVTHTPKAKPHTFTEEEYTQIMTMLNKDTTDMKTSQYDRHFYLFFVQSMF